MLNYCGYSKQKLQACVTFLGLNYGPLGTGNTDTIHPLTTLSGSTPVPEPSTVVLLGSALALAVLRGRNTRAYRQR